MRRRMNDEQGGCSVLGGELGLVYQRGIVRPAIGGEATFAGAVHRLEAQGESDFAVDVDVGVIVVADRFAVFVFVGGDAVADEDDGAGEVGFGGDSEGAEVVADFPGFVGGL